MSRSRRNKQSSWIVIGLAAVFSAGCVHHIFPVVEHPAYVTLPANGTRVQGASVLTEWSKYRRALGNLRTRDGLESSDCHSCTVQVRITAVEGAKYADPGSSPDHTQLIAWIENLDATNSEAAFHLRPSAQAVYAVVADPTSTGMKIRIIEIPLWADRAPLVYKSSGDFAACEPYHQPLTSEADFRPCPHRKTGSNSGVNVSSSPFVGLGAGIMVTALLGDPIWFSCNTGCCTGSGMSIAAD
jgi:hypothetical protein